MKKSVTKQDVNTYTTYTGRNLLRSHVMCHIGAWILSNLTNMGLTIEIMEKMDKKRISILFLSMCE